MKWELEQDGDEYRYVFSECGVAIGFQHLEEMRDGLHGDMIVQSTLPDMHGHVHWCRMNLSSSSTRERLVTTLKKSIKDVEWARMLEIACAKTAIEYRMGDPLYDLAKQPIPSAAAYLVQRFLPAGVTTIMFGDGGTAKSVLALAITMAVQTGTTLPNGLRVEKQTNTLYLDWETSLEDQIERLHALAKGMGIAPAPSVQYRRMYRPIAEESARIRDDIRKHNVGFVVVDSLGFASGGNLKDNDVALGAMNGIRKLGATCLAIAHITKEDAKQEQGRATPFGSGFFTFAARSTWEVRKASDGAENEVQVGLFHRKTNRGAVQKTPIGFTVRFFTEPETERTRQIEVERFSVSDDPELAQHASLSFRLREMLKRANGNPLTVDAMAEKLDAKEKSVGRTLSRMPDALNKSGGRGNQGLWVLRANQASQN